jgi:hypothetical protein
LTAADLSKPSYLGYGQAVLDKEVAVFEKVADLFLEPLLGLPLQTIGSMVIRPSKKLTAVDVTFISSPRVDKFSVARTLAHSLSSRKPLRRWAPGAGFRSSTH